MLTVSSIKQDLSRSRGSEPRQGGEEKSADLFFAFFALPRHHSNPGSPRMSLISPPDVIKLIVDFRMLMLKGHCLAEITKLCLLNFHVISPNATKHITY